jgi:glycosyltransferase involved in cell wall biosynthesis
VSGLSPAPCDVTVAVATMNRPDGLVRSVTAVLSGRVLPGELVIVDQSADDRTAELVAASGWNDVVPTVYLRQARRGLAASRNAAIAHASRPIIAFTDDDCVPDSGWLTAIVAAFADAGSPDGVTGSVLPLKPDRPGFYPVSTRRSPLRAVYRGRSLPWSVGTGGNAAVRREWLLRVHGFDEGLGCGSPGRSAEDMDIFYRLLRGGATLCYQPDAVVFHEQQERARRLASRPSYGFGMGAFCAMWARRGDGYAVWIFARWCYDRAQALAASCVRRRWHRVREELLMLRGAASGIGYGLARSVNLHMNVGERREPMKVIHALPLSTSVR